MPQKLGKGGHGQQNYVPAGYGEASGTYGDNPTGSNKFVHFAKPDGQGESTGIKPQRQKPKQEPEKTQIKSFNGKGKEYLKQELTKKLSGKNGKLTPNGKKLLDQLIDADDEFCGIISNLFENYPEIEIKLGKNLDSKYKVTSYYNYWTGKRWKNFEIFLGNESLDGSESYSKGGVFFHESGHALDNTYFDENGRRENWSCFYKSKEFGKTLSEMIQEELNEFKDDAKFNELKQSIEQDFQSDWDKKYGNEYNELKEKRDKYNNIIMNDPQVVEYSKQIEDIGWDIIMLKNSLSAKIKKGETTPEETKSLTDQITQKQQELLDVSHKSGDLQRQLYAIKYPEKEKDSKRFDELFDLKFKMKDEMNNKKQVAYGDFSDMIEASTGKNLTGMGHLAKDSDYWDYRGYMRGKEAFAEIMSAKATNPESLKVLQKYIPNSIKIFDEIMGEIGK